MVNERIKNNGLNELIESLAVSGGDFIRITRIQVHSRYLLFLLSLDICRVYCSLFMNICFIFCRHRNLHILFIHRWILNHFCMMVLQPDVI